VETCRHNVHSQRTSCFAAAVDSSDDIISKSQETHDLTFVYSTSNPLSYESYLEPGFGSRLRTRLGGSECGRDCRPFAALHVPAMMVGRIEDGSNGELGYYNIRDKHNDSTHETHIEEAPRKQASIP